MGYYENLHEATIGDIIMAHMMSFGMTSVYKNNLWERVKKRRKISVGTFNQTIYRLTKDGYIDKNKKNLKIGERSYKPKMKSRRFVGKIGNSPERYIIIFDIPENKRRIRDWLREQLKFWDFEMIQRSVWVGKGPIPKEFHVRLEEYQIKNDVRIFPITKKI